MKKSIHQYLGVCGVLLLLLLSGSVYPQKNSEVSVVKKSRAEKRNKKSTEVFIEKKIQQPVIIEPLAEVEKEEYFEAELPEVKREFRGAWVATVANINWPSKKNLSTEQQKAEAIVLLDLLKNTNFNAVVFQVRPSADALYKSNYEPWSVFLCGETGKAPLPYYDPLEFWIEEAHKRGLELHVWLNPYRAHHLSGGAVHNESMVRKTSDHIVRLKNGMYWFDPANKKTQDHVSRVVKDIVSRYDIDGVHFDDYFYPYASYNGGADFPDNESWSQYRNSGGNLSRADWRRMHVNNFIERIYKEIKTEKEYVRFGISPFGIWKSGYPAGVVGSSQYDELYADAKLWLNNGWIDYFSPQLYWPVNSKRQNFRDLLEWWEEENTMNRHLWPGLNTVEVKAVNKSTEIVQQVQITNEVLDKSRAGAVHYSIAGLTKNAEMVSALKNGPYKEQALIPKTPWIKTEKLYQPKLKIEEHSSEIEVDWSESNKKDVFQWIVYTNYSDEWTAEIVTKDILSKKMPKYLHGKKLNAIAVKAVDRLGNESDYCGKEI